MQAGINCDMGEGFDHDEAIMPLIQAANIACGYHAGNENIMRRTIQLALAYQVAVGAHPSFADLRGFGRKNMHLPDAELFELVKCQLHIIGDIAAQENATLRHVKPHGALYNMSARDPGTAHIIARAVKAYNPSLILYGLSGSCSVLEAEKIGLKTAHEVFADRTYMDDGSLTPRSRPDALHTDATKVVNQVLQLTHEGRVNTISGQVITLKADTICIHGDGDHALVFAQAIQKALKSQY